MQAALPERVVGEPSSAPRAQLFLAITGMALALLVAAFNGTLFLDLEEAGATYAGAIAVVLAMMAPGVVALVATRMPNVYRQRALTFAAAIGFLVLGVLAILSFGIFFLGIAIGLLVCALGTCARDPGPTPVSAYLLAVVVISSLVLALAMSTLGGHAACWSSSDPGWHRVSSDNQGMGSGQAAVAGESITCTSRLIDSSAAAYTLIALAIGAGAIAIGRRTARPDAGF